MNSNISNLVFGTQNRAFCLLLGYLMFSSFALSAQKRLSRSDSYFGIHFDFHAKENNEPIGATTTSEMIDSVIKLVQPDWIQIDSKGHLGVSSYPTKVGFPAPEIINNPLSIWRETTAKRNVSLYVHHSGVADDKQIKLHPDWAVIKSDGTSEKRSTSLFSPYVNEVLIPQIQEISSLGIDGVWIDGDCWSVRRDYSKRAVLEFQKETGVNTIPLNSEDPNWLELQKFTRKSYRDYLNHYVTTLKKKNPDFEICSNWAFTDHMPETVSVPIDFISGDLNPDNSLNSARVSARYISKQGKPWDLMSWSFTEKGYIQKPAVHLQREAAEVISQGGGYQAYFTQRRDGSIKLNEIPVLAELAKFCRERQRFCHKAESIPQIALLFSTEGHYHQSKGVFSRDFDPMKGILEALINSQLVVDLVGEHHLSNGNLSKYPLLIIPEWEYLNESFIKTIKNYVKEGGNVLLLGAKTSLIFKDELDVKFNETLIRSKSILAYLNNSSTQTLDYQQVSLGSNATPFANIYDTLNSTQFPAASITEFGKGKIAATYFALGREYNRQPNEYQRQFLVDMVNQLFPNPIVKVEGTRNVDVTLMKKNNQLMVNLINTSGDHRTEPIINKIEPIKSLVVKIKLDRKPLSITFEPSGVKLPFKYDKGEVQLNIPELKIHDIIVVNSTN
jgi:hypothetical protein